MHPYSFIFLTLLAGFFMSGLSLAETPKSPVSPLAPSAEKGEPDIITPHKSRILFHPENILSSYTRTAGERQVTFQKMVPLQLSPRPEKRAEPSSATTTDPETLVQLRKYLETRRPLRLGATVYLTKDGRQPARSYLRYWPSRPEGQDSESIYIWTNANLLWLSSLSEIPGENVNYYLFASLTPYYTDEAQNAPAHFHETRPLPEIPEFDDSEISYQVVEGNPTEADLEPINKLLAYYAAHKSELEAAYNVRRDANEQRRLERAANPPKKKNLIIRYWRTDPKGLAENHSKTLDSK